MDANHETEDGMEDTHPGDHFDPALPENQIVVVGSHILTVTHQEKDLVERWFHWFIQHWGLDTLVREPFLLPDQPDIPKARLWEKDNFIALSRAVCKRLGLDNRKITYKTFKPAPTQLTPSGTPIHEPFQLIGQYRGPAPEWPHKFQVAITSTWLENHFRAIAIMAHELMHVRLLGGKELEPQLHPDHEIATDLGLLYRGMALFHAETITADGIGGVYMPGYLNIGVVNYAIALILILSKRKPADFKKYLNRTNYANVTQNYEALTSGEVETLLTLPLIQDSLACFDEVKLFKRYSNLPTADAAAFARVQMEKHLAENRTEMAMIWANNLGYKLAEAGEVDTAIPLLQECLKHFPQFAFALDNYGYCLMMQGKREEAMDHFELSRQIDPSNALVYRNIGIWHLLGNDASTALDQFKLAHSHDIRCDRIYHFMAEASAALGDHEAAAQYRHQQEWCEQNGGHNPIVEL